MLRWMFRSKVARVFRSSHSTQLSFFKMRLSSAKCLVFERSRMWYEISTSVRANRFVIIICVGPVFHDNQMFIYINDFLASQHEKLSQQQKKYLHVFVNHQYPCLYWTTKKSDLTRNKWSLSYSTRCFNTATEKDELLIYDCWLHPGQSGALWPGAGCQLPCEPGVYNIAYTNLLFDVNGLAIC